MSEPERTLPVVAEDELSPIRTRKPTRLTLADAEDRLLLVDAANVVGSRPDGWWHDRAGAAARLVDQLQALGEPVLVVLEGAARAGVPEGGVGDGVQVRHAPGSGDDVLTALAGPGTVLVTADRELADRARERGAEVIGPRTLLARLTSPG